MWQHRCSPVPALAFLVVATASCGDSGTAPPQATLAGFFLNGTSGRADVLLNGALFMSNVESSVLATASQLSLAPGVHQVTVRPTGATSGGASFTLTVAAGRRSGFYAYQATGASLAAKVLADTGAIVPPGKSKVRVLNLAPGSDIDIWRTQPDFQTGIRFQFPFPFNPEPGSYFQSDAGVWHVWITSTSNHAVRLHETGPIDVPAGERRTVAVVDSAGRLRLRVLAE